MKHIFQLGLIVTALATHSCYSGSKKNNADTTTVITHTQPDSAINANSSSTADDERDSSSQPLMTKVIFPDFSVKLNNCSFYGYKDDNNKFIYSGDTITDKADARNYKMWTLTTKNDSVKLQTDDDNGLDIGTIEILPNNKADRFEISYSFKLQIVAENEKDGVLWESMMPYKKIKDSSAYFFSTPKHNTMYSEMGVKINEIIKKFNLKDTAFKKEAANGDYGAYTEHGVIFNDRLCEIPYIPVIYLKIDRYDGNRLIETKCLVIDFSIPE